MECDNKLDKLGVTGSSPVSPNVTESDYRILLRDVEHPCDAPGLHSVRTGESNPDYHADTRYDSTSGINLFDRSPLLYQQRITQAHSSPSTEGMQRGTLVHLLMEIGLDAFLERAREVPAAHITAGGALSTKKESLQWKLEVEAAGKIAIAPAEMEVLLGIWEQADANSAVRDIRESLIANEVSIRWQRADGSRLKCRPDGVTSTGQVIDWKTTRDADPIKTFWSAAREFGYFLQNAVYEEGAQQAGLPEHPVIYVLLSTVPPYSAHAVTMPRHLVQQAAARLDELLADLAARREMDAFCPRDYGSVTELIVPPYVTG